MKKILLILVALIGLCISANAQQAEVLEVKHLGSSYDVRCSVRISTADCQNVSGRTVQVTCTPVGLNNITSRATLYESVLVPCLNKYKECSFSFPCKENESREQCNLYNFTVEAKFLDKE
ncbi:MAG: hypothetical protein LBS69_06665 [Prevotellaceae bacterium]|jgi:hypothetical protein|nr:hypothetical protein [Prevotellaceae bacterium]